MEEAFLFIDTENIRFYREDFYWIFRARIQHLSHVYVYLNCAKRTIHHKFYDEMSDQFPMTIRNLATTPRKKNGLDIHMTMDIMDFVHSRSLSSDIRTTIYIASNDSDFAVVCQRLASPPHLLFGRIFHNDEIASSNVSLHIHLSELTVDDRIIARCFFHWKTGVLTMNRLKKTIRGMKRRLSFPLDNLTDYLNRSYFDVTHRENTTIITTTIFSIPE